MCRFLRANLAFLGLIIVVGCVDNVTPLPAPTSLPPTKISAGQPSFTPLPPPQIITAPTPTTTPPPPAPHLARIAHPPDIAPFIKAALAALDQSSGNWRYQLVPAVDPRQAIASGEADIGIVVGDTGLPAGHRPMALALPFTQLADDFSWASIQGQDFPNCAQTNPTAPCWMAWRDMRPPLKAARIDGLLPFEEGYPAAESYELIGENAGSHQPLAEVIAAALAHDPIVELAAVGDVMLDRSLNWHNLAVGELDRPFASVAEQLRAADFTIGNMESALGDSGEPETKGYTFQAPPNGAEALARAGFDLMSLANNHAMDFGADALLQGIDLLNTQGVAAVGAGEDAAAAHAPYFVEINGVSLAFLAYAHVPLEWQGFDTESWTAGSNAPGIAWGNPVEIKADVAAAQEDADVVIVLLHSGFEYVEAPSQPQIAAARAALEAGAGLVIGHHTHLLQGFEYNQNGQLIAYGLGNFAFDIEGDPSSMILRVWLDEDGVRQLEIMPAIVLAGGYPRLATMEEGLAIKQRVMELTSQLNQTK